MTENALHIGDFPRNVLLPVFTLSAASAQWDRDILNPDEYDDSRTLSLGSTTSESTFCDRNFPDNSLLLTAEDSDSHPVIGCPDSEGPSQPSEISHSLTLHNVDVVNAEWILSGDLTLALVNCRLTNTSIISLDNDGHLNVQIINRFVRFAPGVSSLLRSNVFVLFFCA